MNVLPSAESSSVKETSGHTAADMQTKNNNRVPVKNSFVPLQAVRQQHKHRISSSSTNETSSKENDAKQTDSSKTEKSENEQKTVLPEVVRKIHMKNTYYIICDFNSRHPIKPRQNHDEREKAALQQISRLPCRYKCFVIKFLFSYFMTVM